MHHIRDSLKNPKKCYIYFARFSNLHFSATRSSISPIKISVKNLALVDEFPTEKSLIFTLPSESWQSEKSKECYLYWFRSIFKLVILSHYNFEFLNLKHNTSTGVLWFEAIDFVRCVSILIVRNFHEKSVIINFSRYSNSSSIVNQDYRLRFFYQDLNQKLSSFENFFDGTIVELVPCIGKLTVRRFQIMPFIKFYLDVATLHSPQLQAWYLPSWSQPKTSDLCRKSDWPNHWFFFPALESR